MFQLSGFYCTPIDHSEPWYKGHVDRRRNKYPIQLFDYFSHKSLGNPRSRPASAEVLQLLAASARKPEKHCGTRPKLRKGP